MADSDRSSFSFTNVLLLSLFIAGFLLFGLDQLEDLVRWPPRFDALTVYRGTLSHVGSCRSRTRFSAREFNATLEKPGGGTSTIGLPCISELESIHIGTPLVVRAQPRFFSISSDAEIWDVSSGDRVYLSFQKKYAYQASQQSFHVVLMISFFLMAGYAGWKLKAAFDKRRASPIEETGHPFKIRIGGLDPAARQVVLEVQRARDAPVREHVATLPQADLSALQAVLVSRPFGDAAPEYVLESISQSAGGCECLVRISAEGKRQRSWVAISAETYDELKKVLECGL